MIITLKSNQKIFECGMFMKPSLKNKETDCVLYSQSGFKFDIHKEILYPSKLMKNVVNENSGCCGKIEIVCPCSENELESILGFLYNGAVSCNNKTDILKILKNLNQIFGFPENLFIIEDYSDEINEIKKENEITREIEISDVNEELNTSEDFDISGK